jgi:hypothetical protein
LGGGEAAGNSEVAGAGTVGVGVVGAADDAGTSSSSSSTGAEGGGACPLAQPAHDEMARANGNAEKRLRLDLSKGRSERE